MKTNLSGIIAAAALALLSGCSHVVYKPISVDAKFWQDRSGTIGVAVETMPEPETHMIGPQGLLDLAINVGNAKPLSTKLKSIDIKRVAAIPDNFASRLDARGFSAKRLADPVDIKNYPEYRASEAPEKFAPRDFSSLQRDGIDRLLLITVERIGTVRNYHGFIPLGAPMAVVTLKGQLIDLKTHKLLWYERMDSTAAVAGDWDQEPEFPNVLEAVSRNIESSATQFERAFFAVQAVSLAQ